MHNIILAAALRVCFLQFPTACCRHTRRCRNTVSTLDESCPRHMLTVQKGLCCSITKQTQRSMASLAFNTYEDQGFKLCVVVQCYVQQLRQIRQDAQQSGHAPLPSALSGPLKSGEADWSLLSPHGKQPAFNASLALQLRKTQSGQQAAAMATTEVRPMYCLVSGPPSACLVWCCVQSAVMTVL